MRRFFRILFVLALLALQTQGQKLVMDAGKIPLLPGLRYVPDIAGKVLIEKKYYDLLQFANSEGEVTIFPNWPVEEYGSTERGGIYGNLDDDPELELVYNIGLKTYAFNTDGTHLGGWPRMLDFPTDGAPAYGDIDGDGSGEIVVTTYQAPTYLTGSVYAFEKNGTNVPGFPLSLEGGPLRTPVLADLDEDGKDEIIIAVRNWPEGFIHVYRGNGIMYPNFPVPLEHPPGSAVAVGDITGDGVPEIVAESYYSLHAFSVDGIIMPGFPYFPGDNRVFSYSSPVLADIDGDGLREIIFGDHSITDGSGAVHVVKSDGTAFPEWPRLTDYWIYGPPSIGDINGDGKLDIAVGDQVLSTSPADKVYAWTGTTGSPLPGFPIAEVNGINSQIILADIDGDGHVELMFDDNTAVNSMGKYPGYNHDGTPMEGWPLETLGSTFDINPLVADINRDGILDISGGGTHPNTGNTNVYLWNANVPYDPGLAILPILQYNTRHNGVYGDYLMVGTPEIDPFAGIDLIIFPNPASTHLAIGSWRPAGVRQPSAVSGQQSLLIILSDPLGKKIREFDEITSLPYLFDVSDLDPGIYLLQVITDEGHAGSAKFLKVLK